MTNLSVLDRLKKYSYPDFQFLGDTLLILNKVPKLKYSKWLSTWMFGWLCVHSLYEHHQEKTLKKAKDIIDGKVN